MVVAALSACARRDSAGADSTPDTSAVDVPRDTTQPARSVAPAVTENGIGALRVGMTVAQARKAYKSFSLPPSAEKSGCEYAKVAELPAGVLVMVEDGIVVRVDVRTPELPTAGGTRVGDSEASVRAKYGQRVSVSPHKYTDGHYLTLRSASPGDTIHRIIFETDTSKIPSYRAGQMPQVGYVEGCS